MPYLGKLRCDFISLIYSCVVLVVLRQVRSDLVVMRSISLCLEEALKEDATSKGDKSYNLLARSSQLAGAHL